MGGCNSGTSPDEKASRHACRSRCCQEHPEEKVLLNHINASGASGEEQVAIENGSYIQSSMDIRRLVSSDKIPDRGEKGSLIDDARSGLSGIFGGSHMILQGSKMDEGSKILDGSKVLQGGMKNKPPRENTSKYFSRERDRSDSAEVKRSLQQSVLDMVRSSLGALVSHNRGSYHMSQGSKAELSVAFDLDGIERPPSRKNSDGLIRQDQGFGDKVLSRSPKKRNRQTLQFIGTLERIPSQRLQMIIENLRGIDDFYDTEEKTLGKGSFGSVRRAFVRATGAQRAVKSVAKDRMREKMDILKKEIEITKMVDHPHIIKLYEIFEDASSIHLVLELCSGGELLDRILRAGRFNEVQAAVSMSQILRAIYYLHKSHICHRDLKPANCLLARDAPVEENSLKVTDFGLSCTFRSDRMMNAQVGTTAYMAPQVLTRHYDQSCDLWSTGVIMYMLLCGYLPFHGKTTEETREKVKNGRFKFRSEDWVITSQEAMDLITQLLKYDPQMRATAKQALDHPWIGRNLPARQEVPLTAEILENLRAFRQHNKFKKASLNVIASLLGEEQTANSRASFQSLDIDGDGLLNLAELRQRLISQSEQALVFSEELENIFKGEDSSFSESNALVDYSYTEFVAATFDRKLHIQKDVCRAAFSVFDQDSDGVISKAEILGGHVLGRLTAEELDQLVEDLDANGDGEIDFDEFVQMMREDDPKSPLAPGMKRQSTLNVDELRKIHGLMSSNEEMEKREKATKVAAAVKASEFTTPNAVPKRGTRTGARTLGFEDEHATPKAPATPKAAGVKGVLLPKGDPQQLPQPHSPPSPSSPAVRREFGKMVEPPPPQKATPQEKAHVSVKAKMTDKDDVAPVPAKARMSEARGDRKFGEKQVVTDIKEIKENDKKVVKEPSAKEKKDAKEKKSSADKNNKASSGREKSMEKRSSSDREKSIERKDSERKEKGRSKSRDKDNSKDSAKQGRARQPSMLRAALNKGRPSG